MQDEASPPGVSSSPMIFLAGRNDLPDPDAVVYRGSPVTVSRQVAILARFAALALVTVAAAHYLPQVAGLLLDPLGWLGGAGVAMDPGAPLPMELRERILRIAVAGPLGLLVLAIGFAWAQPWFAYQGRKVALRKQTWALWHEFREAMLSELEDGETPRAIRAANPPELATSLLVRIVCFAGFLGLALLAVLTALALRIHWPERGTAAWYGIAGTLSVLGPLTLAAVRVPPVLRLLIQGGIPALHLGHAVIWSGSAWIPDLALGGFGGWLAYRVGQRERGAALYLVTDRRVLVFDAAGRTTRLLAQIRGVDRAVLSSLPGAVRLELSGPEGRLDPIHLESRTPADELMELLAHPGLRREEFPPRPGPLPVLAQPGWAGWSLVAVLAAALGLSLHHLIDYQVRLAVHLLRHLPAWSAGDPRPLAAGADACLRETPGFRPAEVFRALAAFDLGEFESAGVALDALGPSGRMSGFAAVAVPRYRRHSEALERLRVPGEAGRREEARYLVLEVGGPHAARNALGLLPGETRDPVAAALASLAWSELAGWPEARFGPASGDPLLEGPAPAEDAVDLPERDRVLPALARIRRALSLQDAGGARQAARGHGAVAGRAGALGAATASRILASWIGPALSDAEERSRALGFLDGAVASLPSPGLGSAQGCRLGYAGIPFLPRETALARLAEVDAGCAEVEDLFRILAEESVGNLRRAEFFAWHLIGAEAARGVPPGAIPALAPLEPAHGYYVVSLALSGLGKAEEARLAMEAAAARPGFAWQAWARRRSENPGGAGR